MFDRRADDPFGNHARLVVGVLYGCEKNGDIAGRQVEAERTITNCMHAGQVSSVFRIDLHAVATRRSCPQPQMTTGLASIPTNETCARRDLRRHGRI